MASESVATVLENQTMRLDGLGTAAVGRPCRISEIVQLLPSSHGANLPVRVRSGRPPHVARLIGRFANHELPGRVNMSSRALRSDTRPAARGHRPMVVRDNCRAFDPNQR